MRWISDASCRIWQAYCQGLVMSSPVPRLDWWWTCERDRKQSVAGDGKQCSQIDETTVH